MVTNPNMYHPKVRRLEVLQVCKKLSYSTLLEAMDDVQRIKNKYGVVNRPYKCLKCGDYHMTKSGQRR